MMKITLFYILDIFINTSLILKHELSHFLAVLRKFFGVSEGIVLGWTSLSQITYIYYVWMLVYAQKDKAVRALKKNFIKDEDFTTITQNGDGGKFAETIYRLSISCLEYFIARKNKDI